MKQKLVNLPMIMCGIKILIFHLKFMRANQTFISSKRKTERGRTGKREQKEKEKDGEKEKRDRKKEERDIYMNIDREMKRKRLRVK